MLNKILQMVLLFYNLSRKYTDAAAGGATNGAYLSVKDQTLIIRTGFAAEKTLDADITNESLNISLTTTA